MKTPAFFRELSLRGKLLSIMMLTAVIALLLSHLTLLANEYFAFRENLRGELTALADVIGFNSSAAIEFDDTPAAVETLGALRAEPFVVEAWIVTPDDRIFAHYGSKRPAGSVLPSTLLTDGYAVSDMELFVARPIVSDTQQIGLVFIRYDLRKRYEHFVKFAFGGVFVLLISLAVAYVLANRLQHIVTGPIAMLAEGAEIVSKREDYSARVIKLSDDELGRLTDQFNQMLEQIEARDQKLKSINEELEERVEKRTEELNHEIGVRKAAESALEVSKESFQNIIIRNSDGILVVDENGIVRFLNPAAERLLNTSATATLNKGFKYGTDDREITVVREDGSEGAGVMRVAKTEWDGRVASIVTVRDISSRKTLEAQLSQSQKLEAVGRLAGGVAHDFNNILTSIMGHSSLILEVLPDDHEVYEDIEIILRSSQHAAELTRQLLVFSRHQVVEPRLLDLNEVVNDLHGMLRRMVPEDVELVSVFATKNLYVHADPGQIEQVLMNLVVNSRDAMPDGGTIHIELKAKRFTNAELPASVSDGAGDYAVIDVRDTGMGMTKETISQIFEPFFTTKEVGKGTGLGLATIYGIVKQGKGFIDVDSEVGEGSTITVCLPLAEAPEGASELLVPPDLPPVRPPTESITTATILLVEDEQRVRILAGELLRKMGFSVLEAMHPDDALRICDEFDGEITLMLTDVVMPGMNGRELAQRVQALEKYVAIKVVFMSGYTDGAVLDGESFKHFIQKPFTSQQLAQKVRDALEI